MVGFAAVVALTACARVAMPSVGQATLVAETAPVSVAGVGHVSPDLLLLQPSDLRGWTLAGAAGAQIHPGPGVNSATSRFDAGSGAQARRLYDRVSAFATIGAATAEFKQEQGDIGRSSTLTPTPSPAVGQSEQAYRVDSGVGATAETSVGVLIQERNYLVSLVLSGPHGAVNASDLTPFAQRQVGTIAHAP